MKHLHILLILLAVIMPSSAHGTTASTAANRTFRLVDTTDGLPDNEVKTVFYVPDGRLCIRTSSSLSLFDGCGFRSFAPYATDAFPMDYVASLSTAYVDVNDRVWIKESGRLIVFDLTTESYINNVGALLRTMGITGPLRDFFVDSAKDYWVVTANGTIVWIQSSGGKDGGEGYVRRQIRVGTKGLRDIARLGNRVWLVYGDGMLRAVDLRSRKTVVAQRLWSGFVQTRDFVNFADSGNRLWVMWNHGIASLDASGSHWQTRFQDASETFVSMSATPRGNAFVSVRKGGLLTVANDGTVYRQTAIVTKSGGLVNDDINSVLYSRGNLVLGLYSKGLCLYNPNMRAFPFYRFADLGVAPSGDYRIGQGQDGSCLFTFNSSCWRFTARPASMSLVLSGPQGGEYISSFQDSRGRLWTGTFRHGVYMKDGDHTEHYQWGEVPSQDVNYNIVRCFAEDSRHRIWVSCHGAICRFDERTRRIVPLADKALARYKVVNAMAIDGADRLWAATSSGLVVYQLGGGKILTPGDIVSDRDVAMALSSPCKTLLPDSHGLVWVGTLNGLYAVSPKSRTARRWGRGDGMPNEMVQGTVEDRSGDIWVTTAYGLCRLHRQPHGDFSLTVFDGENKLGDSKFLPQTAARSGDGQLLFGCDGGFYVVNPSEVRAMTYTGHPVLTSLAVNNDEILPGKEYAGRVVLPLALSHVGKVTLRHNENFITLRFSGLNFDMPDHTYYRYRLRGMSDDWTETSPADGKGQATYTALAPGTYTFEVYSAGFDRHWSRRPVTLTIVVKAPLWATWWAKTAYLLAIAAIVVIAVRRKIRRDRKRLEDEKYKEIEEMKYRFFTNISHEFRTLLTLIITPIGSLLRREKDAGARSELRAVSKNAGDLLQLVNQLLDFRKMEMNGETLHLTAGNLDEFVRYTATKFAPLSEQKGISLDTTGTDVAMFMYFDHDKVGKILTNLLSNAFKYTDSGGHVKVTLEKRVADNRRYARISVADTGCGIAEEEQKRIFDRFYRSERQTGTHVGSGIGLNLVYEYVKLHHGEISVHSEVDKGSCFIVDLPADLRPETSNGPATALDGNAATGTTPKDAENGNAMPERDESETGQEAEGAVQKTDKTVLVVEDNDDFRGFLVRELGRRYSRVLSADDGVRGALKAEEEVPDIVVSDVMMPRMSGTDLCRRLKENVATSHIPIILLTAWSTDEGRAEGYEAGADAYIAKPFDMEVLLSRIRNLLDKQEKRIQEFSHNTSLDPKTVTDSSADEKLLKDIIDLIEKNIDNTDYTIDDLARGVLMSRMSLYRKMKSLTGQTPADFIRTVRLKSAARLLKEGRMNVSEVCYSTGFASPQNFSKRFKEMFGVLPSQYK